MVPNQAMHRGPEPGSQWSRIITTYFPIEFLKDLDQNNLKYKILDFEIYAWHKTTNSIIMIYMAYTNIIFVFHYRVPFENKFCSFNSISEMAFHSGPESFPEMQKH